MHYFVASGGGGGVITAGAPRYPAGAAALPGAELNPTGAAL